MSAPRQRRFPAQALRNATGAESQSQLARTVGMDVRQMGRYFRDGIPEQAADRLAIRAGLHPAEVWPEWFGAAS